MKEFLTSDIVQRELYDMQRLYDRLSSVVDSLATFSPEEKQEFVQQTKILIEKQRIFHTRLVLVSYEDNKVKNIVDNMDRLSMVFCGQLMSSILSELSNKLDKFIDLDKT